MNCVRLFAVFFAVLMAIPVIGVLPTAEASSIDEYPGKTKLISDFETVYDDITRYGTWTDTFDGFYHVVSSRSNGLPSLSGSAATQFYCGVESGYYTTDCYWKYEFVSNGDVLQIHTISFAYCGNATGTAAAGVLGYALDEAGNIVSLQFIDLTLDDVWRLVTFDDLYKESAATYVIDIEVGIGIFDHGFGNGFANLSVDMMYAVSPPSYVRFSFYNYYTGLGLNSEILIPEVYYDGEWQRVWNNEFIVAAGETISYRITDYFGQVIDMEIGIELRETYYYIDIDVELVTVYIERPEYWSSSLPPEWSITSLANGNTVTATGWELEVLAGWYNFAWSSQTASAPGSSSSVAHDTTSDIVVEEGNITLEISGDSATARSYSMQDFYLSMDSSTYSQVNDDGVVAPDLTTWNGLYEAGKQLVDVVINSFEAKVLICIGIMITAVGLIIKAKKVAQGKKLSEVINNG